jgi:hypothetical protein
MLSAAGEIFATPFFAGGTPQGSSLATNSLLFDQVYQFTPWRYFAWKSLRAGSLPLWNPYSLAGSPFIGSMQSAVFYPINLLLTAIPFEQTFVWSAVIRLWIAGYCTYLLAQRYWLGRAASFIAACSFMLCGFLVVWLGHPHTNVAIWLPALILAAEYLVEACSRRQAVRAIAVLGAFMGISFTGGHIETSLDVVAVFAVYFIVRSLYPKWPRLDRRLLGRVVVLPSLAGALGAAIAAAQLVPFVEWLPVSAELQRRTSEGFKLFDPGFWRQLPSLLLLVYPNLFNNPSWPGTYWSFVPWFNFNKYAIYVGVIPLALAVLAVSVQTKANVIVRLWTAIGLLSLGMALHLPVLDWLNQLPGFALASAERLRLVTCFSLAILAGFGAQALFSPDGSLARWRWRLLAWLWGAIAAGGLAISAGAAFLLPLFRQRILDYGRSLAQAEFQSRAVHSHPLEYYYAQVESMADSLTQAFRPTNGPMYASSLIALVGLGLALWRPRAGVPRGGLLKGGLCALVVVDLVSFGRGYNPSLPINRFFPRNQITDFLQEARGPFRVTALNQDLIPDAQVMFGLPDVRGLDYPTRWYADYVNISSNRAAWLPYGVILSAVDSPLIRLLNLRYVIATDADGSALAGAAAVVASAGSTQLWELHDPAPRASLRQAMVLPSDEEVARLLATNPEVVRTRVLITERAAASADGRSPGTPANVEMLVNQPTDQEWDIAAPSDAYLVIADAYYPGWNAYVDGAPEALRRADLALRAVPVPAGRHRVSVRYEPRSVQIGLAISMAATLLTLVALVLTRRTAGRLRRTRAIQEL